MVTLASSSIRVALNTNRILSVGKTAQPGECINVYGERFAEGCTWQARDFDGDWLSATELERSSDARVVTLRLPSGLTSGKVYNVQCVVGGVAGNSKSVNEAEIWWCRERVTAGGVGYLYGRNLTACGTPTLTLGGEACTITASNNYRLTFTVPALADGEHSFVFTNDHGSKSPDCTATVYTALNYARATYDPASYGAAGDGVTDDTAAITACFNAARNDVPCTVSFGSGAFLISGPIVCYQGVRITGVSEAATTILLDASMTSGRGLDIRASETNVENLTLDGTAASWAVDALFVTAGPATFQNVTLDLPGALEAGNVDHMRLIGCTINTSRINTGAGRQWEVSGCTITQIGGGVSAVFGLGMSEHSYDGNTFLQTGTNNLGRGITDQPRSAPFTKSLYIGGNTFTGYGPDDAGENTGETILFEPEYIFDSAFSAHAVDGVTQTGAYLRRDGLAADLSEWLYAHSKFDIPVGMRMHVRSGQGVGQVRTVTAADSGTNLFTNADAWEFTPTTASEIEVSPSAYQVVIYGNGITHRAELVSTASNNASTGVSFFAGGLNCVVDGNTFTDVRTGIAFAGRLSYLDVDLINNTFSNNRTVYNFATADPAETEWSGIRICGDTLGTAVFDLALDDRSTSRDGDFYLHNVIVDQMTPDGDLVVMMGEKAFQNGENRQPIPASWDSYDLGVYGIDLRLVSQANTAATMQGGDRGETITASDWQDTIDGGDGDDTINAGARDDQVTGGAGDDTINLESDGSPDRLYYNSLSDGFDTVTGFEAETNKDRVNIDALLTELGLTMAQRASYFAVVITGTEATLNYYAAGDAPSGTATPLMEFIGDYSGKGLDDFIAVS